MFGSVRNVFASRWKALWWAAGVLLTAYCSIPSPDPTPASKAAAAHAKHVNPWASDYHPDAAPKSDGDSFQGLMKQLDEAEHPKNQGPHENPWAKKPDRAGQDRAGQPQQ